MSIFGTFIRQLSPIGEAVDGATSSQHGKIQKETSLEKYI